MKNFLTILIALFAFGSVSAHATSDFDELVKQFTGQWKIETKASSLALLYTGVFRRLKDGAFYTEIEGNINGRRMLSKTWSYRNGKSRTASFVNGRKTEEVTGTSNTKKVGSAKWITKSRYSDGVSHSSVMRKINRNRFVATVTTSDGFRSTSTYTRIGK